MFLLQFYLDTTRPGYEPSNNSFHSHVTSLTDILPGLEVTSHRAPEPLYQHGDLHCHSALCKLSLA